jgi:hypothetical protein
MRKSGDSDFPILEHPPFRPRLAMPNLRQWLAPNPADKTRDGLSVREDADDIGAAVDLAVERSSGSLSDDLKAAPRLRPRP